MLSSMSARNGIIDDDDDNLMFVVKVYRSDQSHKYFPVLKVRRTIKMKICVTISILSLTKDTTAKQVVMLAIKEFGLIDQSR